MNAASQSIQLSPTQQQILNSLPAAEREQAMQALRELNSQQQQSSQSSINEPLSTADTSTGAMPDMWRQGLAEMTAQPRSRIVIDFSPSSTLDAAQSRDLAEDPALQRLIGSQLFVLDDSGILSLQGLERIPLLGLSESEINRRLQAEPNLSSFDVDARILAQTPIGIEALEPFGYDVFAPQETGFDAPANGPVPENYILGPGDSVRVQLYGNVNEIYEHEVSRDGELNLPNIGPVTVAGIPFSEFRTNLKKQVQQTLIGTQVSVTMGQLRTIRVFVLGDVNRPGSYVVSGLATVSAALYRSGGLSAIGSLRNIQLKRSGKLVGRLDAYDLLIRGDNSGDRRLQPGDVIFVPPIGMTVAVGGAVNRPAIYEVGRLTTAADLVGLAGGLTADAFADGARLERIGQDGERTVLSVNLRSESANTIRIQKGDTLVVPKVLPELGNAVALSGHVHRPGDYPWRDGMRLSDLISSPEELLPGVDTDYVLIRRENARGEPLDVLSASLSAALHGRGSAADVMLQPGDTVNVFSLALGRQRVVGPLLEELRAQSTIDNPARQVQISGNVRAPGIYPLETAMRISDLVRAGGNLTESAYALEAELTRYTVTAGGSRESDTRKVDLYAIRQGDLSADVSLQEHDYLIINRVPQWDSIWTITLEGEVQFPGAYRVRRGETLAEVIARAGGLTAAAFPEGAVFLRESLKQQEQDQIETLARRMEADLASLSLQTATTGGVETQSTGRVLLDQLRRTEAVGRLVIDIDQQTNGESIEVRNGDRLMIPTTAQVVTVLGETQQNTSHLYREKASRDEYIALSGGLTRRADKKLIYIVRANGAVVSGKGSRWFGRNNRVEIRPGDTIVVPLDTDRMRPLTFWGNVTQVLYQAAIAVAAVQTFN
ncbi:MAG: SLBB domain-containing protein [Gammaproteobacteria bacterium]|nr:SLBB domain-containing protein [Gammaproteobacteria bacterium]